MNDDKFPTKEIINMESLVSSQTGKAWVKVTWGTMAGQLTPEEARIHALKMLEVAGGAELDAIMFDYFAKTIGLGPERAARAISDFREIRNKLGLNG